MTCHRFLWSCVTGLATDSRTGRIQPPKESGDKSPLECDDLSSLSYGPVLPVWQRTVGLGVFSRRRKAATSRLWSAMTCHRFPWSCVTGQATDSRTGRIQSAKESCDKSPLECDDLSSLSMVLCYRSGNGQSDWAYSARQRKAATSRLWSAMTCHRFLWSCVTGLATDSWTGRIQPAKESCDKSQHSKGGDAVLNWEQRDFASGSSPSYR